MATSIIGVAFFLIILLRVYRIEGIVTLEFIIDKDGSLTDVKVVKDPGGGLGKEAARVVKSMPKWKPGKQNESAVKVKVRAPVRFKLNK